MKKIKLFSILIACIMCISSVNVFALGIVQNDYGKDYIEFTVSEEYEARDINQTIVEKVTALFSENPGPNEIKANGNLLTVSGFGDNVGTTVSIQLKVKGLFGYYKVNGGAATLNCDGEIHHLFNGFNIEAGKTYRFYYKANGGDYTISPKVTLSIVIWDY